MRTRSLDPFYIVKYCIKWVKTPWTHGSYYDIDIIPVIKWVKTPWTHSSYYDIIPVVHMGSPSRKKRTQDPITIGTRYLNSSWEDPVFAQISDPGLCTSKEGGFEKFYKCFS